MSLQDKLVVVCDFCNQPIVDLEWWKFEVTPGALETPDLHLTCKEILFSALPFIRKHIIKLPEYPVKKITKSGYYIGLLY